MRYPKFHEYLTLQILKIEKTFLVSLLPFLTIYYALSNCYRKSTSFQRRIHVMCLQCGYHKTKSEVHQSWKSLTKTIKNIVVLPLHKICYIKSNRRKYFKNMYSLIFAFKGFDGFVLSINVIETSHKKSTWSFSQKCSNKCPCMHVSPYACLQRFDL